MFSILTGILGFGVGVVTVVVVLAAVFVETIKEFVKTLITPGAA